MKDEPTSTTTIVVLATMLKMALFTYLEYSRVDGESSVEVLDSFSTQASAAELHLSHTSLIQSLPNTHNLKYKIESACTQKLNIS